MAFEDLAALATVDERVVHERGDRTQRADEEHRHAIRRSEDVAPGHEEHKHREDGGTAIEEAADLETARADHGTGVIGDLDQARAHDGNCGGDGAGGKEFSNSSGRVRLSSRTKLKCSDELANQPRRRSL